MGVNPVVAYPAYGDRVLFVENGAASGSGQRFVHVNAVAATFEPRLYRSNEVACFATGTGGQNFVDQFATLRLLTFPFR